MTVPATTVTLECEVCGAGWHVTGELFRDIYFLRLSGLSFDALFMADEPQECPECGEADEWDTVRPGRSQRGGIDD